MLFIFLLGHDIDFGHMEAVNLLSSNKYTEKQIVSIKSRVLQVHFNNYFDFFELKKICFAKSNLIMQSAEFNAPKGFYDARVKRQIMISILLLYQSAIFPYWWREGFNQQLNCDLPYKTLINDDKVNFMQFS